MKNGCKDKRCRPPDLEAYITEQKRHYYVTYGAGAREYFSIGRHTMENWAKQAHAIYKINGVKLINIEKIERFIEAFEEVD